MYIYAVSNQLLTLEVNKKTQISHTNIAIKTNIRNPVKYEEK